MGAVEERAPCTSVVGAAGEKAACPDPTPRLPPLHDHGNQPQGMALARLLDHFLLWILSVLSCVALVFDLDRRQNSSGLSSSCRG